MTLIGLFFNLLTYFEVKGYCTVMAKLSQLACHGCLVMVCLSHGIPVMAVLSHFLDGCKYYQDMTVINVLSLLSSHHSPVMAFLSRLSCHGSPAIATRSPHAT
jgi:hypothetical protein